MDMKGHKAVQRCVNGDVETKTVLRGHTSPCHALYSLPAGPVRAHGKVSPTDDGQLYQTDTAMHRCSVTVIGNAAVCSLCVHTSEPSSCDSEYSTRVGSTARADRNRGPAGANVTSYLMLHAQRRKGDTLERLQDYAIAGRFRCMGVDGMNNQRPGL